MHSQGHEEGDVASRCATDHCLVVVKHSVEESSTNKSEGMETGNREVLRLSEACISQHGGRETEATSLDLFSVSASICSHSESSTESAKAKDLGESVSAASSANIRSNSAKDAKIERTHNSTSVA